MEREREEGGREESMKCYDVECYKLVAFFVLISMTAIRQTCGLV